MRKLFLLLIILLLVGGVTVMPKMFAAHQKAQEHFFEADKRIKATIAARKTVLDLSGLTHLRKLPDDILKLSDLWFLNLSETEISSLNNIAQLPKLEHLNLRDTRVKDLTPLAQLPNLKFLSIGQTLVQDLEPLTQVGALERVDISNTEILTLEPATRIRKLLKISLHRSYAHDGSRAHYEWLHANIPEVYDGSAFRQNYIPAPLYLRKTQLNRLADRFYLPQPFPRP